MPFSAVAVRLCSFLTQLLPHYFGLWRSYKEIILVFGPVTVRSHMFMTKLQQVIVICHFGPCGICGGLSVVEAVPPPPIFKLPLPVSVHLLSAIIHSSVTNCAFSWQPTVSLNKTLASGDSWFHD